MDKGLFFDLMSGFIKSKGLWKEFLKWCVVDKIKDIEREDRMKPLILDLAKNYTQFKRYAKAMKMPELAKYCEKKSKILLAKHIDKKGFIKKPKEKKK